MSLFTGGAILAGALASAGAATTAAKLQSGAAKDAANINTAAQAKSLDAQLAAQREATAAQTQATSNAELFARQQAEQEYQSQEHAQSQNYGQWAAGQRRLGTVGQMLGLGDREIPAYSPSPDPHFTGGAGALTSPMNGAGNPTDPNFIADQLKGVYAKLGVTPTGPGSGPTDIAYMAQKVAETGGWTPQNASYWPGRIAQELKQAQSGGVSAPLGASKTAGTMASYLPVQSQPVMTPALQMPGVGSYLTGAR